jgi:hypothetical protein
LCNKHYRRLRKNGDVSVIRSNAGLLRRKHFCVGDTGFIEIADGSYALVDRSDFEVVSKYFWSNDGHGYAQGNVEKINGRWRPVKLHVFLMNRVHAKDGLEVDHCNRQRRDNRRRNLRVVTKTGNMWNASTHRDNKTGIRGVSWLRKRKKYHARITVNKKVYILGDFKTKDEAGEAYDEAAKRLRCP